MRHVVLVVVLYLAVVAQLGGVPLPGGLVVWWLDFALLLALQLLVRPTGVLWCGIIGLAFDLTGSSIPGTGLLCGASCGLLLPSRDETLRAPESRVRPVPIALFLLLFHLIPAAVSTLPAARVTAMWLGSLMTLAVAAVWQLVVNTRQRRRDQELFLVSRQEW